MEEGFQSQASQAKAPVAFLDVRHATHEYDARDSDSRKQIPIRAKDEFCFGRNFVKPEYAQTVSKRHLKFHCVLFDDGEQWSIPPLVYAENLSNNGTYLKRAQTPAEDQPDSRGIFMGSNIRITLLEENDELWFHPTDFVRYHVKREFNPKNVPFDSAVEADMKVIGRRYQVRERKIGEGGHGSVHVAIHRKTQRQLACKKVPLENIRKQPNFFEERLTQEFDVLRDLDHPNIIRLEKVFYSHSYLYILQELVPGGDLFSFMDKRHSPGVPAIEAAVIVQQILKGVDYLHDHGIVHRDLKPDNILLSSTKSGSRVVITDFGQARYLPDGEQSIENFNGRMKTMVGTLGFNAPEIYKLNPKVSPKSGYSKAVDVWSVGCIASHLLSGNPIFNDNKDENAARAIKLRSRNCDLDILDNDPIWQKVGRRAKDFIRRTLVLDEHVRITAKEALKHEWFSNPSHADELEAVYQHAIREWQPKRKVFKLVEFIDSPRPKMKLHPSRFFAQPTSSDSETFPVYLASGIYSVMPSIDEDTDLPGASPLVPPSTTDGNESEIPGPPCSYGDTVPDEMTPARRSFVTAVSQQTLSPSQLAISKRPTQDDLSPTQNLNPMSDNKENLTPTQLLNHTQRSQLLLGHGTPMSAPASDSYILGPPNTDTESISQEMTQLTLIGQQTSAMITEDASAMTQFPYAQDQEMAETSFSEHQFDSVSLGKRQPSFDFDEGIDDADFLGVATNVEFKQPKGKRLRTS